MLSLDAVLKLFLLVFPMMFSPGPTNLICASVGGRFGLARAVPMILGMDAAVFASAAAVGAGLGSALAAHPGIAAAVQVVGAAAVLAVAANMARGLGAGAAASKPLAPLGFWGGMSVQGFNAKGLALLLVVESQFRGADGAVLASALAVAALLTLFSLGSHLAWSAGGLWMARRFSSPRAEALQGRLYAAVLAFVGVWLLAGALAGLRGG